MGNSNSGTHRSIRQRFHAVRHHRTSNRTGHGTSEQRPSSTQQTTAQSDMAVPVTGSQVSPQTTGPEPSEGTQDASANVRVEQVTAGMGAMAISDPDLPANTQQAKRHFPSVLCKTKYNEKTATTKDIRYFADEKVEDIHYSVVEGNYTEEDPTKLNLTITSLDRAGPRVWSSKYSNDAASEKAGKMSECAIKRVAVESMESGLLRVSDRNTHQTFRVGSDPSALIWAEVPKVLQSLSSISENYDDSKPVLMDRYHDKDEDLHTTQSNRPAGMPVKLSMCLMTEANVRSAHNEDFKQAMALGFFGSDEDKQSIGLRLQEGFSRRFTKESFKRAYGWLLKRVEEGNTILDFEGKAEDM